MRTLSAIFYFFSTIIFGSYLYADTLEPLEINANTQTIIGTPKSVVYTDQNQTTRKGFTREEAAKHKLTIVQKGGKFYELTETGDTIHLEHAISGPAHYFAPKGGPGFILMVMKNGKAVYMDVGIGKYDFIVVIYWGELEIY